MTDESREPRSPYAPPGDTGSTPPPGDPAPPPMPPATPAYGGPPPAPPEPLKLPWEDRSRLGFGAAFIETVRMFVTQPRAAFDRALRKGDYGSPVLWTLIVVFISLLVQFIWSMMFTGPMTAMIGAMLPPEIRDEFVAQMAASTGLGMILNVLMLPVFCVMIVVVSFMLAAIWHLCLMVAGGSGDSEAGFETTFRVISYGYTSQLAGIIPFVGGLIALVWGIILMVVGMSSMHRISTGKAVIVVLIPAFLCCACLSVGFAMFFGAIVAAMRSGG